ncbi:MAG: sigma-70 family RNA polymerase sigma factor [Verrucomicrobia bacterium]|nr:sigma-70 family RNA polymerase sigma factor [Verrucomicrobiota bacterium]
MMDSQQLLAEYARNGSDAAFRELVTRYVDLVYSTALRLVEGDTHRAEDVTQTVFVDLSRKAQTLPADVRLGGWLHRDACLVTGHTLRGERRRQSRERQAAEMNALQNQSEADFSLVAPLLDEAINELGEADRTAILLRFFEQQDFRTVGQALGSNEDAARMRVTRALEKLEEFLKRRGVTTSATSLGMVLAANAVQAAPVGLAVTISTAVTTATTTIATHTTMHWLNLKSVTSIVAAAIAAGTATHLVQEREADRLRSENQNLVAQQNQLTAERDAALSAASQRNDEIEQFRKDKNELLKLRGEIGGFRKQVVEIGKLREENERLRATSAGKVQPSSEALVERMVIYRGGKSFPKAAWAFAGYADPEAALATWTWAMNKGDKNAMLASLAPESQPEWQKLFEGQSDDQTAKQFSQGAEKLAGYTLHSRQMIPENEAVIAFVMDLPNGSQSGEQKMKVKKMGEDWRIVGPAKE